MEIIKNHMRILSPFPHSILESIYGYTKTMSPRIVFWLFASGQGSKRPAKGKYIKTAAQAVLYLPKFKNYKCAPWLLAVSLNAPMDSQFPTDFIWRIQIERNICIHNWPQIIWICWFLRYVFINIDCDRRESNLYTSVLLWAIHSTGLWICLYGAGKFISGCDSLCIHNQWWNIWWCH